MEEFQHGINMPQYLQKPSGLGQQEIKPVNPKGNRP